MHSQRGQGRHLPLQEQRLIRQCVNMKRLSLTLGLCVAALASAIIMFVASPQKAGAAINNPQLDLQRDQVRQLTRIANALEKIAAQNR